MDGVAALLSSSYRRRTQPTRDARINLECFRARSLENRKAQVRSSKTCTRTWEIEPGFLFPRRGRPLCRLGSRGHGNRGSSQRVAISIDSGDLLAAEGHWLLQFTLGVEDGMPHKLGVLIWKAISRLNTDILTRAASCEARVAVYFEHSG